jgi:hypothetical protein
MLIVGIYVDHCLILGKESSISKKHKFNLKIENDVGDALYLMWY